MKNEKQKKTESSTTLGVVGLVLSIFGLIGMLVPFIGILFSIAAIVCGYKQNKVNKTGMGTASFYLGILGTVINTGLLLMVVGLMLFALSA